MGSMYTWIDLNSCIYGIKAPKPRSRVSRLWEPRFGVKGKHFGSNSNCSIKPCTVYQKWSLEEKMKKPPKVTDLSWTTFTVSSGPMWPMWLKLLGPEISLDLRNSALPYFTHTYTASQKHPLSLCQNNLHLRQQSSLLISLLDNNFALAW